MWRKGRTNGHIIHERIGSSKHVPEPEDLEFDPIVQWAVTHDLIHFTGLINTLLTVIK